MSSLPKAPFIPAARIERRMEEELARANLMPSASGSPVVDIEAFLERHLRVSLDQFADLESDVLGVTHFVAGKAPLVEINRDLTDAAESRDEPWLKGRWRITMAHEAGHVILHGPEVEAARQQFSLFGDDGSEEAQMQRCMKRDLHQIGGVDPREVRANYAMAALLMPRDLFSAHAARVLPSSGTRDASSGAYWQALADLAGTFQVSKEAVRIRIEKLGLGALIGQDRMKF